MKDIIKDSFIYLSVESEMDDFNIWEDNSEGKVSLAKMVKLKSIVLSVKV